MLVSPLYYIHLAHNLIPLFRDKYIITHKPTGVTLKTGIIQDSPQLSPMHIQWY
jgi:hypothetical protein